MEWVYDNAIVSDLANCIDPEGRASNTVRAMGEDGMMGVLAQLQDDKIAFPALFLARHPETPLDASRYNFTRAHIGVPCVFDSDKNNVYLERSIPIELKYDLHALTTNTADMDEIMRELLFRYTSMYYLTIQVPYESKRNIRFGVAINPNTPIRRNTGVSDYVESGKIYESVLELECQGAVVLDYIPRHMESLVVSNKLEFK